MRTLVILRGAMGVGKSTFIKTHKLEQHTLSLDSIRLLLGSVVMNEKGKMGISSKNDKKMGNLFLELLEKRMKDGEFLVVDATHTTTKSINAYKELCKKYKYRAHVIDFSEIPKDVAMERNSQREEYKQVPKIAINMAYSRFADEEKSKIPGWVSEVTSYTKGMSEVAFRPHNIDSMERLIVIGDIHGSVEPLKRYFEEHPFNPYARYVFCGDYIDRGIAEKEVLEMLINLTSFPYVSILEGNHELHLGEYVKSKDMSFKASTSTEFFKNTYPKIKDIGKKELKKLWRKMRQMSYLEFGDYKYVISHGGFPIVNDDFLKIPTSQMIKGVGKYEDIDKVYAASKEFVAENKIRMVHGHRNSDHSPIIADGYDNLFFNLEGSVEMGGCMRVLHIEKNGDVEGLEFKNDIIREDLKEYAVDNIVGELTRNPHIHRKDFGHISSFNFTNQVFFDKSWTRQNVRARGLFLNNEDHSIVMRSYDKFFNLGEMAETQGVELEKSLSFPMDAYEKENGFLGIVGYDKVNNELVLSTKSTIKGEHVGYFRKLFDKKFNKGKQKNIMGYLKRNNATLVFEVVDIENDPHIVNYKSSRIILLDIVENLFLFKKYAYDILVDFGETYGIEIKKKIATFHNVGDALKFISDAESNTDLIIEGYVYECSNGFMFKQKLDYYNKWKSRRFVLDKYVREGKVETLRDERDLEFLEFIKTLPLQKLKKSSIIDVRNEYNKRVR